MLYRFQIELSDVDRSIYETLDFRVSQHPSEVAAYLLSRVIAYALSYEKDLEFSPGGLSDPDAPALRLIGKNGTIDLWIEIGNPAARRLHKAGKTAKKVIIYTYKKPEVLINDIKINDVHRANEIQIYAIDMKFLEDLEKHLQKNNRWSLLFQDGHIDVNDGVRSTATDLRKYSVSN